jgi:hypothetical protein
MKLLIIQFKDVYMKTDLPSGYGWVLYELIEVK